MYVVCAEKFKVTSELAGRAHPRDVKGKPDREIDGDEEETGRSRGLMDEGRKKVGKAGLGKESAERWCFIHLKILHQT